MGDLAGNREGGGGNRRKSRGRRRGWAEREKKGEEMRKKKRFSLMYSFNKLTDYRRVFSVGFFLSVGFLILAVAEIL